MSKINTSSHIQLPAKKERHRIFGSVEPGPKTKPQTKESMVDIQNTKEDFLFEIDAVGVGNVKYPIVVHSDIEPYVQTSIGTFSLTSRLDRMKKGTNMSRFMEQLETSSNDGLDMSFPSLLKFAKDLQKRLNQDEVTVDVQFPWFYQRRGPFEAKSGMNHSNVGLKVTYHVDGTAQFSGSLSTYVTTLCPCSKEISEYSAHSQRGLVTIETTFTDEILNLEFDWKKPLLDAAESNASAVIYPVLKRPDEKTVTEAAYENPRFVEDLVRLVAADVYEMPFVKKFKITCKNEESIHLHDAIATIEYEKEAE